MKKREIEIIIPADGSDPSIDLEGYEGHSCSEDFKHLMKELEAKSVSRKRKPEYFRIKQKNTIKNTKR